MLKTRILSVDRLPIKYIFSHATCFIISHRSCVQLTSFSVYFPLCQDILCLVNSHVPDFKLRISLPGAFLAPLHQKQCPPHTKSLDRGNAWQSSLRLLLHCDFHRYIYTKNNFGKERAIVCFRTMEGMPPYLKSSE